MQPELTYPNFSLQGRKALVTGGGKGIGRALALGLAQAGAAVAVSGRKSADLEATVAEIRALGAKAHAQGLDVRDTTAVRTGVDACCQALGGLDILVNNAGIESVCDSLVLEPERWDDIVDTNLKGAFFCAQAAGRIMAENVGGAMVNLCSLTSGFGVPTAVPYTSSKSALLGMTRALSAEWATNNIRVNAIAPGYFRTALTEVFFENEHWTEGMLAKIPMGRFGHVQDLIGVVVFLCAEASAYITGQMIYVDGGTTAAL